MPLTATEHLVSWAALDHNTVTKSKNYSDARKWIAQGADLNACAASYEGEPNHVWDTALIWAARRGDEEMVRFFLTCGAKVDAAGANSGTPLTTAIEEGHSGVVKVLLQYKADPNVGWGSKGRRPLVAAIVAKDEGSVKSLLESHANIHATNGLTYFTALHYASAVAQEGSGDNILEYLLASGADVNIPDCGGRSSLPNLIAYQEYLKSEGKSLKFLDSTIERAAIAKKPSGPATS